MNLSTHSARMTRGQGKSATQRDPNRVSNPAGAIGEQVLYIKSGCNSPAVESSGKSVMPSRLAGAQTFPN